MSTAKRPRTIGSGRCQIHFSSPSTMLSPTVNITVKTVTATSAVSSQPGTAPLIDQPDVRSCGGS